MPSFLPQRKEGGDFININPIIEAAFSDFEVNKKRIPIAFLSYTGNADTYLTYYTWQEQPENFFDDEHHAEVAYGTIDICAWPHRPIREQSLFIKIYFSRARETKTVLKNMVRGFALPVAD